MGQERFVSIHAPARGATHRNGNVIINHFCFNPRARAGRDTSQRQCHNQPLLFQSTRPRGARLNSFSISVGSIWFQSTRPRGARRYDRVKAIRTLCFNPRARAGRDSEQSFSARVNSVVSIHAPARGATSDHIIKKGVFLFQSTRPRGARPFTSFRTAVLIHCFNPRARAGRDCMILLKPYCSCCFNPRARAGRDIFKQTAFSIIKSFNPRARAGRDLIRQKTNPAC